MKNLIWIALFVIAVLFLITGRTNHNVAVSTLSHSENSVNADFTILSPAVKNMLSEMSLREKIAQMIISYSDGYALEENSAEFRRMRNLIEQEKIGGFIFFKGNSIQEAELINRLQQLSETPLLMSADFERGTKMRLDDGSLFPNNMALGATGDENLAYQMGLEIAKECRAIGIHQNYAPVLDVNNNPLNPIINVRSFGEDPDLVSKLGVAMIRGLQDGKVIATAKHFPGHGDTDIDSHNDLPVLNLDMSRLETVELPPFKAAIDSGVMSVMIAHLSFPLVDDEPNIPSSLSGKLIEGLLIDKMGFNGLVVTDALNMAGVVKHFSTEDVAVRCASSGVDLILMPQGESKTIDAIESAVLNGQISEETINTCAGKILSAKEWLNLFESKYVDVSAVPNVVNSTEAKRLASEIAEASMTLVKNEGNPLPFTSQESKRCLVISLNNGNEKANSDLFLKLFTDESRFSELSYFDLTGEDFDSRTILDESAGYDMVVIPVYAKVKIRTGTVGLPSTQIDLINRLASSGSQVCVISFGNPYLIQGFPGIDSYVCAYSDSEASVSAAVSAIFGKTKFKGKLPITVSDEFGFGHGITN